MPRATVASCNSLIWKTNCLLSASLSLIHIFCSMKITQDVREYAAKQGLGDDEALREGLKAKAMEFVQKGSVVYLKT